MRGESRGLVRMMRGMREGEGHTALVLVLLV